MAVSKKRKSISGKAYDVISIGDCTLDMFLGLNTSATRFCRKGSNRCFLEINYADKVEADSQDLATGGNSSNLAIGSSRLGLKSAFYTVLGKDGIADMIIKTFKDEQVAMDYVEKEKGKTNFHVVLNHEAERTIIIFHHKRKYKLPKFKKAEWAYYSSMGEGFQAIHKDLVSYVQKNKVKLGFNPGTLQFKAGYKVLKPVLEVTEVLLLNTQEGQRLLGAKHDGVDFKNLLFRLYELGPKQVVVTDGPKGAYAFDGENYWYMPIFDVPVIERTGAGDSFSTGVISALVYGKPMQEALRWGTFNSASVIQKIGPQDGLLKKSKMQKFLRSNKNFLAKSI